MSSATTPRAPLRQPSVAVADRPPAAVGTPKRHVAWLAGGIVVSFAVPFVFADTLELPRDLYYLIYGVAVMLLCAGWMRDTGQSLHELVTRRWRLALVLGVLAAGLCVALVLASEDATSRPSGIGFVAAIVWRGLVYGAIDGLFLTAFPILVVFAALSTTKLRRRRRGLVAIGAAALAASLLMTATYHAGYSDFRSDKLRKPLAGDLIWAAPVLATWNPIGAPIAHAGLHTTAVVHSYETDLFLPPH
jgi:peptidoglycan/LPS O-acetylase OafA/YrhL